mmetsp:Transcript_32697/g.95629  ORF Transcript_32697/g.95629 Transcript_32697/m.95629 type:complete len:215 (+) Transcript_32697:857-1501(+)
MAGTPWPARSSEMFRKCWTSMIATSALPGFRSNAMLMAFASTPFVSDRARVRSQGSCTMLAFRIASWLRSPHCITSFIAACPAVAFLSQSRLENSCTRRWARRRSCSTVFPWYSAHSMFTSRRPQIGFPPSIERILSSMPVAARDSPVSWQLSGSNVCSAMMYKVWSVVRKSVLVSWSMSAFSSAAASVQVGGACDKSLRKASWTFLTFCGVRR